MNVFLFTSVPIVPPWDQGDKNLAYGLTQALPEHRFSVLTARGRPAPEGANLDRQPLYRCRYPPWLQKAWVYAELLRRSARRESRDAPDLYHLIYRPYALFSWLNRRLPAFRRRPILHTVPATCGDPPLDAHFFFADQVVALSEYGQSRLLQLGLPRVAHIPVGIQVERWASLRSQGEQFKARLGLSGHPLILFPGHYGRSYGADVLLRALPAIAAGRPEARFLFACRLRTAADEAHSHGARRELERLGLSEMVDFQRTVADMRLLIGACDLTVLPLETMQDKLDIPTTLLESLAAGRPVVVTDLPPMNELLRQEVGLAVPAGDAGTLAQAILALLDDEGLRARMGQRGAGLVQEHYDIRQVARQYAALYQEMVR